MARIRVVGRREPVPSEPDLGALRELKVTAANVQAVQAGATRAGARPEELDGLDDDTIVELTLDNGARFYHSYRQLKQDLPRWATRGGPHDPDTIELPLVLPGSAIRGGRGESVIESVRTFDLAGPFGDAVGGLAGKPLASKLDQWLLREPEGLRFWSPTTGVVLQNAPLTKEDLSKAGPWLLLIHGTGSSTSGSFGAINASESPADPWRKLAVDRLAKAYEGRMVAFDHHTLNVSPIQNAINLIRALPEDSLLHVISHSRGGMIGELLCRAQRSDGKGPFQGELKSLKRWARERDRNYGDEFALLEEFERLLIERRPRVERFVRVACPAAGTTLASGRLDIWLSTATSVLDLTGLGLSPTYQFLKGFLLALIKSRTDPEQVPGLEAMLPNSLLTLILNRPGIETTADLSVISGDIEGTSVLARLGLKVVDWFYGGDHDLIVDTVSMYGGLARKDKAARFFIDKGSDVNHFGYFRNRKTLEKVVDGLARLDDKDAGFTRLEHAQEITSEFLAARRAPGTRPPVLLVPDAMGSHLSVGGSRIWIDATRIAQGQLGNLVYGAPGVMPDGLVADAYGDLAEHLSKTHEVKPFAYDWRLPLLDNGKRFAEELRNAMTKGDEPVGVIAHGSGGLVALAALAANDELRSAFSARKGARLLLLGTPLSGSVAMARVLLGHDRLIRYLAMLDLDRPEQDIAGMFREFPGLVGLLPEATLDDLFTAGTWSSVLPDGRPLPDAKVLQEARAARDKLATLKLDSVPLAYVGAAEGLALSMQIAGSGVRFFARQGGDAALAADRSLLPNSAVSWAPTQAGALAGYRPAFDAYADLLVMGSTRRLPMPSSGRSNAPVEAVELFPDVAPVFPDERELAAAALGYVRKAFRAEQPKTELKVVHGHLAAARWPVAVGHYEGDTLNGGEEALDRALDRRLTRRRNLRVYPGPIGTAEVILDPARSPLGALVVGIGRVGELTPGALRRTLTRALRRYALAVREQRVLPEDQMALSMIMIGTGEGGVGTRDALTAILQAFIQANKRLEDNAFKTVEFFELFEDRAIQAAHELAAALRSEEFSESFDFDGLVQSRTGGHRQSAGYEDPGWWRRLQVRARKDGELRFTDLTDRARVPVSLVASERKQVDEFVRGAVIQTHATDEFPASATLYELLLPPRLKEESHNDRNVVLVLDQRAASYPWELLRRPGRDDKPMSIRAGMIRQLTEMQLPERPIISIGNEALVVGDPPSGLPEFGPLPGARAEAELVVQRLRADFDVTDRIHRADGSSSLPAILCGRWRLMHLAGHGAFRFKKDGGRLTGMALEGGGFFTPQNVAQMEAIPEFVFLNCCYLGATDPTAEKKIQRRYHELAANMATAFIKLGAHAVIAAGWAVDDSAARYFADVFYHRMLEGETFGVATTAARRDVYNRYGVNNNTWGAYQCYGDSAYRLLPERRAARVPQSERPYVHVREPIVEVSNLAQQAKVLALADPAQLRERLETVVASIQVHRWSEDAELQAAFGNAYGDLGMIDKAIEAYTLAVRSEKAWAPIRAIEQLANLLVRRAARQAQPDARKVIREAIATLKHLPKLADGRPTSERLSLLGSCCKRLAFVTAGKERMDALKEMSRWYKLAYERKQENAEPDRYYPLLNWLLAENLRALLDGKLQVPKDMDALLTQAEADAAAAYVDDPQFWHAVAVADVVLGRALLTGDLHLSARQAGVVEAYLKPWRRGASALQFASVLEQIDFVAAVLKDDTGAQPALGRKQMCEALQAIALQLRAATQVT